MQSVLETDVEEIQLIEEILSTAKDIFLSTRHTYIERIGAFYLMYSVYFKQPSTYNCKIRFTLLEWVAAKTFITKELKKKVDVFKQLMYIFYKLIQSNAFEFMFMQITFGLEYYFEYNRRNKRTHSNMSRIKTILKGDFKDLVNRKPNIMSAINIIENNYVNMRKKLFNCFDENEYYESFNENICNMRKILNEPYVFADTDNSSDDNNITVKRKKKDQRFNFNCNKKRNLKIKAFKKFGSSIKKNQKNHTDDSNNENDDRCSCSNKAKKMKLRNTSSTSKFCRNNYLGDVYIENEKKIIDRKILSLASKCLQETTSNSDEDNYELIEEDNKFEFTYEDIDRLLNYDSNSNDEYTVNECSIENSKQIIESKKDLNSDEEKNLKIKENRKVEKETTQKRKYTDLKTNKTTFFFKKKRRQT